MPGSVTISHTDALVMLSHADADRLATTLLELSALMADPGGDRITDAQLAALCGSKPCERIELAEWSARLADYLKDHL
ncbi:hypothetical protein ABT095_23570 [Kitasatospora sp. NPDC002227]|uniref:hypothetical protein n=1 Tax=Kitasatospora sp. NPDC002227 TaxID=3154773 RepID=UPI00331A678F